MDSMQLVTPAIGLMFWTVLIFVLLVLVLNKFAWKPILNAVDERNNSITEALSSAKKAKAEMEQLSADNEKILNQARIERDSIIKEAKASLILFVSSSLTPSMNNKKELFFKSFS